MGQDIAMEVYNQQVYSGGGIVCAIEWAIDQLNTISPNCYRENLTIAYSPVIKRYLIAELMKDWFIVSSTQPPMDGMITICGVKVYEEHPYNEIVVYHPDCCYNEKLRIKLELKLK